MGGRGSGGLTFHCHLTATGPPDKNPLIWAHALAFLTQHISLNAQNNHGLFCCCCCCCCLFVFCLLVVVVFWGEGGSGGMRNHLLCLYTLLQFVYWSLAWWLKCDLGGFVCMFCSLRRWWVHFTLYLLSWSYGLCTYPVLHLS